MADMDVLGDRQLREEQQLLIDRGDAMGCGLPRRGEARRPESLFVSSDATGTVSGAVLLAGERIPDTPVLLAPLDLPIEDYWRAWREALPA